MTKDVLILFSSVSSKDDVTVDKTESVIHGTYYKKNNNHYLLYDEVMEGFKEPVKSKVKFGSGFLDIVRSGPINVRMIFEENRKNMTSYNTPYGNLLLGINTKRISILDSPDEIELSVDYALEAENEPFSNCNIVIKIEPVDKK